MGVKIFFYLICLGLSQAQLTSDKGRARLYLHIYDNFTYLKIRLSFPDTPSSFRVTSPQVIFRCSSLPLKPIVKVKKIKNAELNGEWSPSAKYTLLPENFLFLQRQGLGFVRLLTFALLPQVNPFFLQNILYPFELGIFQQ